MGKHQNAIKATNTQNENNCWKQERKTDILYIKVFGWGLIC